MSFSVPTFNVSVSLYTAQGFTAPARVVTVGNLAFGRRVQYNPGVGSQTAEPCMRMTLLLPVGTDVRDQFCASGADGAVVPTGSGRTYKVTLVDDIGRGFANEHRAAILEKVGTWPTPIP